MERLIIDDLYDIAQSMYIDVVENKKVGVTFTGLYEEALEIVKYLLGMEDVFPYSVKLLPPESNGYEREYFVSLEEDLEVYCEPAWDEESKQYLYIDGDVAYTMNNCNSDILKAMKFVKEYEVSFDDDECCGECCCGHSCKNEEAILNDPNRSETVRVAVDDNGHIHGFEKSWIVDRDGMHYHHTISHYSNDETKLCEIMNKLGIKM